MQLKVAAPHMPASGNAPRNQPGVTSTPGWSRPLAGQKPGMVPRYISEKLTMLLLQWSQECLRQGCTLLATYKCTLPPFLAQCLGLRPTVEKWSQTVKPLVGHGAV